MADAGSRFSETANVNTVTINMSSSRGKEVLSPACPGQGGGRHPQSAPRAPFRKLQKHAHMPAEKEEHLADRQDCCAFKLTADIPVSLNVCHMLAVP